jgi:hypothetical protein
MKKQRIHVATVDVEINDLFGEINAVISFLTKIRDEYKNGEHVEVIEDWSGYEDNYFGIQVHREETDEECLKREDTENKALLKEREKQNRLKEEQVRKEAIKEQIKQLQKQL